MHLTVTDSSELSTSVFRDILPNLSSFSLETDPPGLTLELDGASFISPQTVEGVVGIIRVIGAPSPQVAGATTYSFDSWSDGGEVYHSIHTPPTPTTYTASYSVAANEADLDVTVTDSADPAEAWRFLTYTVTATNNGPGPAFGVTLTDTLPSQADFFSVEPGALCAESGGLVTCDFGDMDVGLRLLPPSL